jgi:hypothetical protein
MDDPRWEPGMPVLDRQPVGEGAAGKPGARRPGAGTEAGMAGMASSAAASRPVPPRMVPETAPTPLQRNYINLSAIALVAGFIAITALETGSSLSSPLVKACILVAAPILIVTTADASLRIWRSAWAWLPVDRGRGLFRFAWLAAAALGIVVFAVAAVVAVLA